MLCLLNNKRSNVYWRVLCCDINTDKMHWSSSKRLYCSNEMSYNGTDFKFTSYSDSFLQISTRFCLSVRVVFTHFFQWKYLNYSSCQHETSVWLFVEAVYPLINNAIVGVGMNNVYQRLSLHCLCEPYLSKTDLIKLKNFWYYGMYFIVTTLCNCEEIMQIATALLQVSKQLQQFVFAFTEMIGPRR